MNIPRNWPWYAAGAGALLLLAGGKKSSSSGSAYDRDVDSLTRMLLTETGFGKSQAEMAQIVNVALNRARHRGISPTEVVFPARPSTGVAWNLGPNYRTRYNAAHTWSSWPRARAFVQQVVAGAYPNKGYGSFVHPAAPQFAHTSPCRNPSVWSPTSTPAWGTRCLPNWIHGGERVGTALFV